MDYYFAYGSNLNMAAMQCRCPRAVPIQKHRLHGWRLVFRGVADIERAPGQYVDGFIFQITPRCEQALDRYEGFPHSYVKGVFRARGIDGARRRVMFYVMPTEGNGRRHSRHGESLPPQCYLQTIITGFFDCGLNPIILGPALKSAADYQRKEDAARAERWRTASTASFRDDDEFQYVEDEDLIDTDEQAEREAYEQSERQLPLHIRSRKVVAS